MSTHSREMDGRCSVGNRLGRTEAAKTHMPSRGHQDKQANSPAEPQKHPWTGRIRCQRSRDSDRVRGREGWRGCRPVQGTVRPSQGPTHPTRSLPPLETCFFLQKGTPKDPKLGDSRGEAGNTDVNQENSLIDGEISSPLPACFPDH